MNAIEGALAAIAQVQANTSASIVQLATSAAALVQHAGIPNVLPPSEPPAAPVRTYAAIAGAPVPAADAAAVTEGGVAMEDAAADASAAAGSSWHEQLTPASADGSALTGAPTCAETDMDDGSIPAPADAPVSMRTRASLAIATMLPTAPGTLQGTVEGPLTMAAAAHTHVHFADEWDGEYDAETDESDGTQAERVFFDDADDDDDPGDDDGDMQQRDGESSGEHEARLNGKVPSPIHFCCRLVFS